MPPRSNPGSIVYDHFGWTILITEESLKNISIYLEGQLPSDAAPPSPQKTTDLEESIKAGAPISKAVADADAAHPGRPTTIEEMLDVAAQDPKSLGGLIKAPHVGAFEKAEAGEGEGVGVGVSLPRRGSIPVSAGAAPDVVMEESLLRGNVSDHMETSYFEAIQRAFAELMKDGAVGGKREEEERA
jgi:hypothetical protein